MLADDAPSLAVYVPWLSLFTSLPPSVASWYHVAAVASGFFFLFVSFLFRPVVGVVRTRPWRTSTAVPSIHRARLLLGLLPCQDAAGCTSSVCTAGAAPGEHTDRVKKRGIWSELPKCFFHTRKIFADFTWVWILSEKAEQTHLQPGDVINFFDLGLFSGWRWKCFT